MSSPPLPHCCVQATGIACCPSALGYAKIDSAEWFQGSFASTGQSVLQQSQTWDLPCHMRVLLGVQSPKPWDMGHEKTVGGLLCPFPPPVLLPLAILFKGGTVFPAS